MYDHNQILFDYIWLVVCMIKIESYLFDIIWNFYDKSVRYTDSGQGY